HGGLLCWSPSATASGYASSLARPVLATPVRAHRPRYVPEPGKLGHVLPDGLTASTLASLPLRLPRRVAIFVSGVFSITPPPWRLLVRSRFMCGYLVFGNFDSSTSTTATLRTASSTMAPSARLSRHRHKGLPSACVTRRFSLQSQHPHHTDVMTVGGC